MRLVLTLCLLVLLTTACSKVPSQSSQPYSFQDKLQSADHWSELAEDMVAKQVKPFFTNAKFNKPEDILGVYVSDKDMSTFGIAFQTYLTTELFDNSLPVSAIPDDCFTLDWSVQKVVHHASRKQPGPPAGIFGALAYGIGWIFGGDYYAYGNVPHTELLVTLKVKNGNLVYSRETITLYINDEDTAHYWVLPDRGHSVASLKKGASFCRDASDLEMTLPTEYQSGANLKAFVSEGRCAISNQDYQVTILEENDKYFVIKHADNPNVYFTSRSSLGG